MAWFLKLSVVIRSILLWTTTFIVLWFYSRVLWNDSLFHSCLDVLTHFIIAFYCIILNSYVILLCCRKMEHDPRQSVHDNHLPYYCVPEMCWSGIWWLPSIPRITKLCNRKLAVETSHSNFRALLVVEPHLHPVDTLKYYR